MNEGAPELIKWWDALECVAVHLVRKDVERCLSLARECRHPDAQWLASLFLPVRL
jgi:hypothetical protein